MSRRASIAQDFLCQPDTASRSTRCSKAGVLQLCLPGHLPEEKETEVMSLLGAEADETPISTTQPEASERSRRLTASTSISPISTGFNRCAAAGLRWRIPGVR